MTQTTHGDEGLFCEKCGIKVRPTRAECPRCFGPVVARQWTSPKGRARDSRQMREVWKPALMGAAAVALAVGGTWFALGRAASRPLVTDPVPIGRSLGTVAQATGTVGEGLEVDLPVVESGADAANALAEGDLARALEEFRIVLRQQPDNLTALNNVGQILVRLQRPAEAVPVLERAVAISPDTWMLRFNLARAQGEAGIWSRAAEQYRAASELMPEHYPTLFNLGIALKKAGQPEAAAGALAQAAALDATQADPWLPLATTLEGLGRPEEARQAYEKFLNLSPESPERAKVEQHLARSKESGAGKAAATAAQAATAEQKPSGG